MIVVLILPLVVLVAWLLAEFRTGRSLRILLGVVAIAVTGSVVHLIDRIAVKDERDLQRSSIRLAGALMDSGQATRVQQAIAAFNTEASANSTSSGTFELWNVLNHGLAEKAASETPAPEARRP